MSNTLILNSSNVVGSNKNTFQYNFIQGTFKLNEDSQISVSSVTIPYSWFNITSNYNNKQFSIKWVNTGATTQTYTLPDGFYSVADLNAYIQQLCIANGWYLVDGNGSNVYYINLSTNQNYYAVQLLLFQVPTSLPTGFTQPSNWAGYPTTSVAPTFSLASSGSIGSIVGFPSGTWGGAVANVSQLSTLTPNLTPVNSLVLRCSLCENNCTVPSDILDSIPINAVFGSNITYAPSYEKFVKCKAGTYSSFQCVFSDQNLGTLFSQDANVAITLLIKQ